MRAQQLDLIYSQSDMLYEILPDAPRLTFDKTKQKSRPHADSIVGSAQSKPKKGKGDKKAANNSGEGKNEKRKVKFLCKICTDDHLTHQCPRLEEAQNLLAQQQSSC
jgi:hypothetical protein